MDSSSDFSASPLRATVLLVACALALAACSPAPVTVAQESFAEDSPYQRKFGVDAPIACEGARRALLGDGYVIEKADGETVKGRKAYPTDGDRSTFVEMSVVCVPDPEGGTLYANGVLSTYAVKKSTGSASVGLSAFGSLSLPIGQSADSMVKTAEETVNDRDFYRRFFVAVEGVLAEMERIQTAPAARSGPARSVRAASQGPQHGAQGTTPRPPPPSDRPEPANGRQHPAAQPVEAASHLTPSPHPLQESEPGVGVTPAAMEAMAPATPAASSAAVPSPEDVPPPDDVPPPHDVEPGEAPAAATSASPEPVQPESDRGGPPAALEPAAPIPSAATPPSAVPATQDAQVPQALESGAAPVMPVSLPAQESPPAPAIRALGPSEVASPSGRGKASAPPVPEDLEPGANEAPTP
jgi:hypothetical protein